MNISNLALTLDNSLTTACGHYIGKEKLHTFKLTKEFAANLTAGDYVLVSHDDKLKVAIIDYISPEPIIEVSEKDYYEWAFAKVNTEKLNELKRHESELVEKMKMHKAEFDKKNALKSIGIER